MVETREKIIDLLREFDTYEGEWQDYEKYADLIMKIVKEENTESKEYAYQQEFSAEQAQAKLDIAEMTLTRQSEILRTCLSALQHYLDSRGPESKQQAWEIEAGLALDKANHFLKRR